MSFRNVLILCWLVISFFIPRTDINLKRLEISINLHKPCLVIALLRKNHFMQTFLHYSVMFSHILLLPLLSLFSWRWLSYWTHDPPDGAHLEASQQGFLWDKGWNQQGRSPCIATTHYLVYIPIVCFISLPGDGLFSKRHKA